jgi:hypothetical protein
MASTYLSRTPASAGNQKTFTISTWIKFHQFSPEKFILTSGAYGGSRSFSLASGTGSQLDIQSNSSGVADYFIRTNRLFRDVTGWYHIVVAVDTTQATSTDRVKIYVNGVQETSFSSASYPSLNFDTGLNSTQEHQINGRPSTSDYGSVSHTHYHLIDGIAYDASTFGETDATTGIWKPKTAPSVTYGTNGFFLKFENSGSMGLDSSPNGNDFTVNGTLTQTVDTPSNVFATFNPLKDGRINAGTQYKATFSNGNTTSTFSEATYNTAAFSTLAVSKGKWYTEIKCSNTGGNTKLGLFSADDYGNNDFSGTYLYDSSGTFGGSAYGDSFTTGDIIQIAFDATNGTLWFGKNGTWQNSATQSEIENGTTTNAAATGIDMTQFWNFGTYGVNGTAFQANFGNGYFGTTAVSSATSDESGLGIFEYTVPSGYYALCTKNINEQEYD